MKIQRTADKAKGSYVRVFYMITENENQVTAAKAKGSYVRFFALLLKTKIK